MKKFLFTLASLVAFGFAANAAVNETMCTMSLSEQEISLHKGETHEITFYLNSINSDWKGGNFHWKMLDPAGEMKTGGVGLDFTKDYGTARRYQYFGKVGISNDNEVGFSSSNGIAASQADILADVYHGEYVWITAQTSTGICYYSDEAVPTPIGKFRVIATEDWDDEYATLTLVSSGISAGDGNEYVGLIEGLNLKINNLDYKTTQAFEGDIEIGDNNGRVVPITYMTNDPNAVAAVTVDGVAVNVAFTVEGPDADGVYTGTGSVTLGDEYKTYTVAATLTPSADFEGEAETASREFTFTAPLPVPDISIQGAGKQDGQYIIMIYPEEGAGELTYVAEPTEDDVKVENGVTYLYFDMGAEPYDVTILAETAANDAFQAGEEEATITVPALDKVKTPRIWAVIDDPEDGKITVYAESTTDGATCYVVGPDNQAHEAPYTFEYDIYEGVNENWYAYATAPYMTQSDNSDAYNIFVAEQEKLYQTPDPEIVGVPDYDREVVVITVTGEGNIDVTVTGINGVIASKTGTEPVVIEVPFLEVGSDPETVSVKAVATAALPQGYDRVLPATVTEYVDIPAKQEVVPGNLQGTITFSEVNQNDGTFTVTYEGPEEGVTVTIDNYAPKAGFTVAATANGKLPEYGTYTVTATAHKADYNDLPATADLTWNAPEPSEKAVYGDPVVGEDNVTVPLVSGNVTGAVDQNGNPVNLDEDGNIVLERRHYEANKPLVDNYTVTVTTVDEGHPANTVDVVVAVPVILDAPEITVTETDAYGWYPDPSGALQENGEPVMVYGKVGKNYVLTGITTDIVGGTIKYTVDGGEERVWEGDPFAILGNGEHTIIAWVEIEDMKSPEAKWNDTLQDNFTGVNEIMNGKAVANVRYFNMAGQEMQEANGVTIVVTTYTDGTTSAVKVMK